jgi:hypothetical protein
MTDTILSTLKTNLDKVLAANGYKPGSQKARICEFSFLQGAISAKPELVNECPVVTLCLMSGRSILTLGN